MAYQIWKREHHKRLKAIKLPSLKGKPIKVILFPMPTTIRFATLQDLPAMLEWRGYSEAAKIAITREFSSLEDQRCIFLAFMGETLIGTVQLSFTHSDPDLCNAHTAYIMALEVRLEYRRQGVAAQLMDTLEQNALARGMKRLTLMVEPDNIAAILFYRRMGYKLFKDSSFVWDGSRYITHCMEKHLAA